MGSTKYLKMSVALLLTIGMATPLFSTGAREPRGSETAPTLVWVHHFLGGRSPEADQAWANEVFKKTGIKLKIVKTAAEEYRTKVASMIAAGDQIDLAYLNWDQFDTLVQDNPGLFLPLEDRISKSPVFQDRTLFPDPNGFNAGRKEDGHIYGTVYMGQGAPAAGTGPIVRWDWMEKLGFASEVYGANGWNQKLTLDDYYRYLKAFALNDPDGNSQKDTYGITFAVTVYDATPFFGTLGLNRLYAKDKSGEIYSPWTQDAAAPVFEWLAKLYREQILEPNFVTNGSTAMREAFMSNRVGMIVYWPNWIPQLNDIVHKDRPNDSLRARAMPLPIGKNGQRLNRSSPPAFNAIPSTSKYKDEAFKLVEFFNTEAGAVLAVLGAEGYDWTASADGSRITLTQNGLLTQRQHGVMPLWNTYIWKTLDKVYNPDGSKFPAIRPEELEAIQLLSPSNTMEQLYGRDEAQWEEQVPAAEFGRIIRGEVSVLDGLAAARKHMMDLKLVDY